jgi:rhodanese-related sulfurtransferase
MIMPGFFQKLFSRQKTDFKQLVKEGAIILDVRSESEYARGHIQGALNTPVGELTDLLYQLKDKNKPIITCCASGSRSKSAQRMLEHSGYKNVFDGGGWQSLQQKIK